MPALVVTRGLGHRGSLAVTGGLGRTGLGGFGTGIPGGGFGPSKRMKKGLMPPSKLKPQFKAKELPLEVEVEEEIIDTLPERMEASTEIRQEIDRLVAMQDELRRQMMIVILEDQMERIKDEIARRRAMQELAAAKLFLQMINELVRQLVILRRRKEEEEVVAALFSMGLLR
jgi:hypothetical protein